MNRPTLGERIAAWLGCLFLALAPVLGLAAIWTHGPNSARLGGTGVVSLLVGGILLLLVIYEVES